MTDTRFAIGWGMIPLAALTFIPSYARATDEPKLRIEVIKGDDAINSIRWRTARNLEVQVLDENSQPVAGVVVTFTLPETGASASFENGKKTLFVTTDAEGHAMAWGLRPNSVNGPFEVRVTTCHDGTKATALIRQINVAPPPNSGPGLLPILAAVGGGVAVAVLICCRPTPIPTPAQPSQPQGTVLGIGSSTFGPP